MEDNIIDVKCKYCGCEKGIRKENAVMVYSICLDCQATTFLESKDEVPQNRKHLNIPKCPTCGSVNIKKISTTERVGSVAIFGLFSKKINKSFKCNDCGYTW